MRNPRNNIILKLGILLATTIAFIWYANKNWADFQRIGDIPLQNILLIITGQVIIVLSNVIILRILVNMDKKKLSFVDSARVTTYSSLINFFGFLQAGVGFRGAYLKKYLGMSVKRYVALTTLQYCLIFGFSALLMIIGYLSIKGPNLLWLLCIALIIFAVMLSVAWKYKFPLLVRFTSRISLFLTRQQARYILFLVGAATLQLGGSALAFGVGLKSIGAEVTVGGFLLYVGLAQFAIVFAVTPGAIGIREGLLLLIGSQMLLTTQDIVLAATIDRIVYCITLLLITPLALTFKKQQHESSQKP